MSMNPQRPPSPSLWSLPPRLCFVLLGLLALLAVVLLWGGDILEEVAGVGIELSEFILLLTFLIPWLITISQRWTQSDQSTLLWLIALALKHQLSLADEVSAYARSFRWRHRRKLHSLADSLEAGLPLSTALECFPGLVSPDSLLVIRMGEKNGPLADLLINAAAGAVFEQRQHMVGGISFPGTMLYLWFVIAVTTTVCSFQMYWIIPKFKRIFEFAQVDLPPATLQLMSLANWAVRHALLVILLALLATLATADLFAIHSDRKWLTWLPLRFPRSRRSEAPIILRSLAACAAQHRPIRQALEDLSRECAGRGCAAPLLQTLRDVEAGRNIWESLHRGGLVREGECTLLHSAERAGNLPWALEMLAQQLERRRLLRLQVLAQVLQPVLILLLGVLVCGFCLAMFLPIVTLIEQTAF